MTRQKGKRWKRGQACVSNPTSKKHRLDAAAVVRSKRQRTEGGTTSAGLSVALKNLDDTTDNLMADDEGTHVSALSTWTIASGAAGKLPSFERVRKLWNSPLDSHKEVCAVLTAITDVIKCQGEKESPIAYFAALLTALDSTVVTEQRTAISYLLSLVIPAVPQNILRAKFAPSSKLLLTVLESQSNKDMSVALVRSLLTSLTTLLTQQDRAVWSEESVVRILEYIIRFVYHAKPKIRHSAQRSLAALSRDIPVVCTLVLQSCIRTLGDYTGSKEAQVTVHTISFIRYIIPHCSESELRAGVEALLRVITLRHTKVTSAALQALNQLFKLDSQMTGEMQGQIILTLYSNKPTSYDHPVSTVWLEALSSGYTNLAKIEPKLGVIMGHSLFSVCSECILSKNNEVVQLALVAMEQYCVTNIVPGVEHYVEEIKEEEKFPLFKIVEVLKTMLKLTYQAVWDVVLQVVGSFFQYLPRNCVYLVERLTSLLFIIRDAPDFENTNLFTSTAGHVIKLVGVQKLLEIYPLAIESGDNINIPNGWLLPILRDNIEKSELQFFISNLVPLTATLKTNTETLQAEGKGLDAKVCFNLEYQVWNLLPSFCRNPTDLMESFKKIAKTLGTLIIQRPDIRNIFCTSLITLIHTCRTNEGHLSEIGRFAKNFLPILFNIFLSEPKPEDPPVNPVKECIISYLGVCPEDTLHVLFEKMHMLAKSQEEHPSAHVSMITLQLLVAMIAQVSLSDLNTMYTTIIPWLTDPTNSTRQKRAYQILHSVLDGDKDSHVQFVSTHLSELYTRLAESLALALPAAKKHRLKCLLSLVKRLELDNFEFVPTILPEIILCVKEPNEKTRVAAFKCIVAIGYVLVEKSPEKREAIKSYFEMVIAGLTGSTQLASATLLCLSKIIYEYSSYLETEVLDQVMEIIVALMHSKQREIIKGVISFVKAAIGIMPYSIVEPHLKPILETFGTWDKSIKHHFRAKVKTILERMLRRFGYALVHKLATPDHKKVVNNIVKEQRRLKKSKRVVVDAEDGEEDMGEEEEEEMMGEFKQLRGRGSRKELTSHLVEDDNPLDFLDSSMIPRIYKGSKKEPCSLPEKDGKMLIEDLAQKIKEAQLSDVEEEEEEEEEETKTEVTNPFSRPAKGIHRRTKHNKNSLDVDGSSYKSKKSKGDMKKSGKQDPYAYISLKQQKGKKKAKGQFDNIIKASRKGAAKGAKSKKVKKSK